MRRIAQILGAAAVCVAATTCLVQGQSFNITKDTVNELSGSFTWPTVTSAEPVVSISYTPVASARFMSAAGNVEATHNERRGREWYIGTTAGGTYYLVIEDGWDDMLGSDEGRGINYSFTGMSEAGGNFTFTPLNPVAVPEPTSVGFAAGLALGGFALLRRRLS